VIRLHDLATTPGPLNRATAPTPVATRKSRWSLASKPEWTHAELGFESPEEAALAEAPTEARVLDVTVEGDKARVHLEVNRQTGYDMWNHCERRDGRWFDVGHNG
jgi:hypothetical protein